MEEGNRLEETRVQLIERHLNKYSLLTVQKEPHGFNFQTNSNENKTIYTQLVSSFHMQHCTLLSLSESNLESLG